MRMIALRPAKDSPLRFLWDYGWGTLVLLLGFAPLALLNIAQLASLVVLPFSKDAFRAVNRKITYFLWARWWAGGLRNIVGLKIDAAGDELPRGERAVVIANHQAMADIMALQCYAEERKLTSDVKWLVKDALKWVPGFGWGMWFADFVFLKRDWAKDEANIKETFQRYSERKTPFWLLLFPEGTRLKQAKLDASNRFAEKAGVAATRHVMLPRPKGFTASVMGMEGQATAVYSFTIGYYGPPPKLWELMRGDVDRIWVHAKRHPIEALPKDAAGLARWLNEDFREKDRLLEQFARENE